MSGANNVTGLQSQSKDRKHQQMVETFLELVAQLELLVQLELVDQLELAEHLELVEQLELAV